MSHTWLGLLCTRCCVIDNFIWIVYYYLFTLLLLWNIVKNECFCSIIILNYFLFDQIRLKHLLKNRSLIFHFDDRSSISWLVKVGTNEKTVLRLPHRPHEQFDRHHLHIVSILLYLHSHDHPSQTELSSLAKCL